MTEIRNVAWSYLALLDCPSSFLLFTSSRAMKHDDIHAKGITSAFTVME